MNTLSRRDFIKLGAATAGALITVGQIPQIADAAGNGNQLGHETSGFIFSMRERLSGETQEFLRNHHVHLINFEGRTVSIDDPSVADDISLANHFDGVVSRLRAVELSGKRPQNIANYKGDVTPDDIYLNFDHTTFTINRTDKNELLTQTTIGKMHANGLPETELDINKLRSSLMIFKEGKENGAAWFDNVSSPQLLDGKLSQIVVNSKLGAVFQITTDAQNAIKSTFTGIRGSLTLEHMKDDLSAMEIAFTPATPAFLNFIQSMKGYFQKNSIDFQKQGGVDQFFESVFSPRATPETRRSFFNSIEIDEKTIQSSGLGVLNTLYSADFPTNMDLAIQLMGAYRILLELTQDPKRVEALISEAVKAGDMFNIQIPQESIPTLDDEAGQQLRDVTNSILQKEVLLPYSIPQLHIVQVRQGTQVKQVLVARYAAHDTSTLNSFATTVVPGEHIEYISDVSSVDPMDVFGYGLFNEYDKESLQMKFKSVGNTQYADQDPASWSVDSKLYGWTVDTAAGVLEARQEAVRIYYDPAASGSRLFTGIGIPSSKGEGKIIELRPGSMKSNKYTDRVQSANRPIWFLGNHPYSLLDVTDKVVELRKKGFTTASQFGFKSPPEAAAMVYGLSGSVDYSRLEQFLGDQKTTMIQYGNPDGILDSAHSILIAQQDTQVTRYTLEEHSSFFGLAHTQGYVASGTEIVDKNMLMRAYELTTIGGKKMVVVAKNKDDGTMYCVPVSAMEFVGVDRDLLVDLKKALLTAAIIWGGYKIYSMPSITNALERLTKTLVQIVFK